MRRAHSCHDFREGARFALSRTARAASNARHPRLSDLKRRKNHGALHFLEAIRRPCRKGGNAMKVKEAMCNDVQLIGPDQTIRDAALRMVEIDAGALPVAENDRLVGMITDRDIAVRAVAQGKSPDTKVRDIMSGEVLYCFDDEDLTHVSRNMSDMKVRRLPVVNRDKRLVGVISVGDIARNEQPTTVGRMVSKVSEPGGKHSQAAR
jgi:CBS domain-containing protein